MVRMLVLSTKLEVHQAWLNIVMKGNVDVHDWFEYPDIPRLSDYEIVVLDMEIPDDNNCGGAFLGLREETRMLLESGGVLVCLNYLTKPTDYKTNYNPDKSPLKRSDIIRTDRLSRREINYDWMFHLGLLSTLNVAQVDARIGTSFRLTSKDKIFTEYFKEVTEYHKTIDNVVSEEDKEGNFLGYAIHIPRWTSLNTRVVSVTKVTKKPIACIIEILNGSLIFLPQSQAKSQTIIGQLYAIGKSEYEKNIQRIEELPSPPEWLEEYKTKQELDLEKRIEKLVKELEQRKLEHKRFEKIDILLYGTGTPLELAVQKVLEEMGCNVKKQEKGATIDFKARIDSMKFAIEVTGVDDKINKNSKKFAQILQYLPHKEKNEKILLLVNTYRNMDVKERTKKENFTETVVKIAQDNEFCLMKTKDLYFMWKSFLNGEDPRKTLAQVFTAKGEFAY